MGQKIPILILESTDDISGTRHMKKKRLRWLNCKLPQDMSSSPFLWRPELLKLHRKLFLSSLQRAHKCCCKSLNNEQRSHCFFLLWTLRTKELVCCRGDDFDVCRYCSFSMSQWSLWAAAVVCSEIWLCSRILCKHQVLNGRRGGEWVCVETHTDRQGHASVMLHTPPVWDTRRHIQDDKGLRQWKHWLLLYMKFDVSSNVGCKCNRNYFTKFVGESLMNGSNNLSSHGSVAFTCKCSIKQIEVVVTLCSVIVLS